MPLRGLSRGYPDGGGYMETAGVIVARADSDRVRANKQRGAEHPPLRRLGEQLRAETLGTWQIAQQAPAARVPLAMTAIRSALLAEPAEGGGGEEAEGTDGADREWKARRDVLNDVSEVVVVGAFGKADEERNRVWERGSCAGARSLGGGRSGGRAGGCTPRRR